MKGSNMEEQNIDNIEEQYETEEFQDEEYTADETQDEEYAVDDTQEEKEEFSLGKEIFSWVRIFVIAIVIALVINNFIIINANVPSGSMENTIITKDRMIGLRTSYWFSSPKRGDIVIFDNPEYTEGQDSEDSKLYVKRVIGLPGEKITIKDAKIYINDAKEPLKEKYLKEEWYVNAGYSTNESMNYGELTYYIPKKDDVIEVKDGDKYLDGQKIKLKDSYITEGKLKDGKYTIKANCYFVLGDNRNDSRDARYWNSTNYISEDAIDARAVLGYYPWRGLYDRPDYNE